MFSTSCFHFGAVAVKCGVPEGVISHLNVSSLGICLAKRGLFAVHTSRGVGSFSPRTADDAIHTLNDGSLTLKIGISFW